MLYLDIKGTSDLDCPYIDIDTGWVNRIFKHLPEKAWDNTIINMNICVEYGTGDLWYSRVRTFEGSCCAEYILTSRKPRKNNRRELVNNPEDQLLGFDTAREAGQVLSLAVLFCLAKISVYAYKKNCKGKGYCKGMGIRVRSETYKIGGGFRVQKHVGGIILR